MADEFEGKPDPATMDKLMKSSTFSEGLDRVDGKSAGGTSDETPDQPDLDHEPETHEPPEQKLEPPAPTLGGDSEAVSPEDVENLSTNPPTRFDRYDQKLESDLKNNDGQIHPRFNSKSSDKNSPSI